MADRLFGASWHNVLTSAIRQAAGQVEKLDRKVFLGPSLDGHLEKIAKDNSLEIAEIDDKGISARRRITERDGYDGWGDRRTVKQTWLDVTIPFTGDSDSFKISPTSSTLIYEDCSIGRNSLTLTIPDDDGADAKVKSFVEMLRNNLRNLKEDYERDKPQIEQAIRTASEQRKAKIDAEEARDKTLSFPVKND